MIIRFSTENWKSFKDKATFSMIASRERQHGERVPSVKKYQTKILPISAIYGGNASGKSNFFDALQFVQVLVVNGTLPDRLIPVETFKLDPKSLTQPTKFEFELLINEEIYAFSFSVTKNAVLEEKLVQIFTNSETVLYERKNSKIEFHKPLSKIDFLKFAFQGTRENQLFLTNAVFQNVENFQPIYNWFKDSLKLIGPNSKYGHFDLFHEENNFQNDTMNEMLQQFDTGITRFGGEEVPIESIPEYLRIKLQEELKEGQAKVLAPEPTIGRFLVSRTNGNLIVKKLITYHSTAYGSEVKFEFNQESDGTKRVIDLLPAFLELSAPNSKKVYVIDELDRSLHTLLTKRMLETFLASCSNESRSQLLFTTHDVHLMDQEIFRRDEMWVAERDNNGCSELFSFSEYKDVRYDKDIRKSYLQGRLGGIPHLLPSEIKSKTLFVAEEGKKY